MYLAESYRQEVDPATETLPQTTAAGEPENGNDTLDFTRRKGRLSSQTEGRPARAQTQAATSQKKSRKGRLSTFLNGSKCLYINI